jgi:ABC-type sugar transport system permease subunit
VKRLDFSLLKKRWGKHITGYAFLVPSAALLAIFVFIPMVYALAVSFTRWDLISPRKVYIGLGNYRALLNSADFWNAVSNTIRYTLGVVPVSILLGLGLAVAVNKIKFKAFFRAAFFLPVVTSVVAISMVWMWIYHPNYGLANALLGLVGIEPQRWLSSPKQALLSIIIMSIWREMGYNMVIYLAGLQGISRELYESARIDGANSWHVFRSITWPLLSPTTFFLVITSLIKSVQVFGQIHTMTQGGPVKSTSVLVYYLYEQAFQSFRMGYASSIAYLLFIGIMLVTFVQMRVGNKLVHYQ